MSDNKDDVGDSLSDILGPELNAELNAPRPPGGSGSAELRSPARAPLPPGGAARPLGGGALGAPLPPSRSGASSGSTTGFAPIMSKAPPPPPPPASLTSGNPVSARLPPSRPAGAPGATSTSGAGLGAPRPPGALATATPMPLPGSSGSSSASVAAALPAFAPTTLGLPAEASETTPRLKTALSPSGSAARPPLPAGAPAITKEVELPDVDFAAAFGDGAASSPSGASADYLSAQVDALAGAVAAESSPASSLGASGAAASELQPEKAHEAGGDDDFAIDDDDKPVRLSSTSVMAAAKVFFSSVSTLWRILLPALMLGSVAAAVGIGSSLHQPVPPPKAWRGYMASAQPLATGPGTVLVSNAAIERGEPVERLGQALGFALVRDDTGRVGYVPESALSLEAPVVSADEPFPRCQRRLSELDGKACEQRSRQQLDQCRATCKQGGCADKCATRFVDCNLVCNQVAPPPAAVTPTPTPVAPSDIGPKTTPSGEIVPSDGQPATDDLRKSKKAKHSKKAKVSAKRKSKKRGIL